MSRARYRPRLRSRHPSHRVLRPVHRNLPLFPFRTLIRLGSSTVREGFATAEDDEATYGVVINTAESIKISANKLRMKEAFERANVQTAPWFTASSLEELSRLVSHVTNNWESRLVVKNIYGSRGRGNSLVSNQEELHAAINGNPLSRFIFEKFMPFALEYRIHVTSEGYFYTCRKALRQDAPESERWRRHDDICVWFLEENESFRKPNSWDDIVQDCVNALNEIGADILSFDVKVQSETTRNGERREYQEYILLECNSASSLGSPENLLEPGICAQKYIEELPRVIQRKFNNR